MVLSIDVEVEVEEESGGRNEVGLHGQVEESVALGVAFLRIFVVFDKVLFEFLLAFVLNVKLKNVEGLRQTVEFLFFNFICPTSELLLVHGLSRGFQFLGVLRGGRDTRIGRNRMIHSFRMFNEAK